MHRPSNKEALTALRTILRYDGARAALIFLNALTAFRFSALYRFEGETLQNLCFYDREHPDIQTSPDIPVLASYCVFVRSLKQKFSTVDSLGDERTRNHVKRRQVQAYCGVPLLDSDGNMFGSICHFNLGPMSIPEEDVALLEAMGRLIKECGTSCIAKFGDGSTAAGQARK